MNPRLFVWWTSLACALAATAAGRDPEEAWRRVAATPPHAVLKVRTFDGQTHRGLFERAGPAELRLRADGQETTLARSDIARVEIYTPSRRVRNLLIGLAVGGAVGVVGAFGACPSCAGEYVAGEYRALLIKGGLAGAGLGAALSQLGSPYRAIYKSKRPRR